MNLSADASHAIVRGFCEAFDDCSLWHGSARNFMLLGTRDAHVQVSAEQFARQWHEPAVAGELAAVGFELPEQLGAAFIGDAAYLNELTRGTPPLTDDRPKRIAVEGPREQRDALIWEWRDTTKARERFQSSALIARLWPPGVAKASLRQFENQRLINDLLFPEVTPVRQTRVLHTVLHATGLQLPVLLLLGSDPDIQRVLAAASSEERERPQWLMHRVAGYLASRNYSEALTMLARVPREALPLTDLPEYLDFVIKRDHDRP